MAVHRGPSHSTNSSNLADLLERVLDKGIVIAGDIKVKLVDIELLTIQIRLVICSIDKAKEMGMDWWANQPIIENKPKQNPQQQAMIDEQAAVLATMQQRLAELESELQVVRSLPAAVPAPQYTPRSEPPPPARPLMPPAA